MSTTLRSSDASWPPTDAGQWPQDGSRHWAAEETMDPRARSEIVLSRLRAQIEYAWRHSDFYKRQWQAAGVDPSALRELADLARFPVITKQHLRADQEAFPPFGSNVCCSPVDIARIHGSSGTTGRPTIFVFSRDDWSRIGRAHARIMWSFGVRPGDAVFIGSLFSLYMGSWGALAGAEALNCRSFPFGAGVAGQTQRAIEFLQLVRPSVFYGTPSYALHLATVAGERSIDPKTLGFRVMFFSGEPGAGIPATKRRIESTFGAICVDTGTMAEMTPWMTSAECDERTGMHLWEDIVYTEIVDPETHQPVADGVEGVPVYTHLERTSQPMIRLFSGDLTHATSDPCPCGRTYRRLPSGIYGRVDDMLTIRGVNVYPHSIEDAIASVPGVGGEYRIVVERPDDLDVLGLEIEAADPALGDEVSKRVKRAAGITPIVTVHPPNTLETTELKARRVVDHRRAG